MKKSNVVVFIIAIIASAFLLWLWFFLGFNRIDAPFDLVLSIVWWVVIVVACVGIWRLEKKRQERIRTCFVADRLVYNSEVGTKPAVGAELVVMRIHDILKDLKYNFTTKDLPENTTFDFVVRSKVFDLQREEDKENGVEEELVWEGEVGVVARPDEDPIPFESREELFIIMEREIAAAQAAAAENAAQGGDAGAQQDGDAAAGPEAIESVPVPEAAGAEAPAAP